MMGINLMIKSKIVRSEEIMLDATEYRNTSRILCSLYYNITYKCFHRDLYILNVSISKRNRNFFAFRIIALYKFPNALQSFVGQN